MQRSSNQIMPQEGMDVQQERRPVGETSSSLNVTKAAVHKGEMERRYNMCITNEAG